MAWVKQSGGGAEYSNNVSWQRLGYTTLCKLAQNPGQLAMIRAAAHHPDVVPGVMSEEVAEAARENIARSNAHGSPGPRVAAIFARGRLVKHTPSGRKVTIVKAAAGRKDGETVHEVVDAKSGKRFLARESNLRGIA